MSTAAPIAVSADELLTMPDGDRYELLDGELKEKEMGARAASVGNKIASRFELYSEQHGGNAFGDGASYRCYDDPDQVRKPDASYIRPGRLAEVPDDFLEIPPDIAVEVISPTDRYRDVELKVDEYLEAGVALVWVVNPDNCSVRVFRSGRATIQLGPSDELTAEDIAPGFHCKVADLFPPRSSRNA